MTKRTPGRGRRQQTGAPPIIEDARLPRMGEAEPRPTPVQGRIRLMADEPQADKGKQNRMRPFSGRKKAASEKRPRALPDQEAAPPARSAPGKRASGDEEGPGYLRLRVQVENNEMTITGGKVVPGPLVQAATLHPGLIYEVTRGGRSIAHGLIPDAGLWRSYPDPEGRPAMQGHHLTRTPSYEIAVRIPLDAIRRQDLPQLKVSLYQWQGSTPVELEGKASIREGVKGRLRPVAELKGMKLDSLPRSLQAELKRAIR